jgi:hypothetical protein
MIKAMTKARGATKFFTRKTDILTGTPGPDRFVLRKSSHALVEQIDEIVNYQRKDVIDLPGSFGRNGRGVVLGKPLFTWRLGRDDLGQLIERNLSSGFAGLMKVTDSSGKRLDTILIWNTGRAGFFSNEDVLIGLGNYKGPVTIV